MYGRVKVLAWRLPWWAVSTSPEGCRELHSVRAGEDCLLLLQLSHLNARCRSAQDASVLVLPSTKAEDHQPAVTAEAQLWGLAFALV